VRPNQQPNSDHDEANADKFTLRGRLLEYETRHSLREQHLDVKTAQSILSP
jgi:hypothetical protein